LRKGFVRTFNARNDSKDFLNLTQRTPLRERVVNGNLKKGGGVGEKRLRKGFLH